MNGSGLFYIALMLAAGFGIPLMAAMNTGMSVRLSSPVASTFILTLVSCTAIGLLLAFSGGVEVAKVKALPPHLFLSGLLFLFYIFSITISAPKIGLANAIFLVLLGQLVAAAIIDHYGLFGVPVSEISLKRVLGILIMVCGIYLARKTG